MWKEMSCFKLEIPSRTWETDQNYIKSKPGQQVYIVIQTWDPQVPIKIVIYLTLIFGKGLPTNLWNESLKRYMGQRQSQISI
jgi:hypothetical protein